MQQGGPHFGCRQKGTHVNMLRVVESQLVCQHVREPNKTTGRAFHPSCATWLILIENATVFVIINLGAWPTSDAAQKVRKALGTWPTQTESSS